MGPARNGLDGKLDPVAVPFLAYRRPHGWNGGKPKVRVAGQGKFKALSLTYQLLRVREPKGRAARTLGMVDTFHGPPGYPWTADAGEDIIVVGGSDASCSADLGDGV
jgi:hypothetical protein